MSASNINRLVAVALILVGATVILLAQRFPGDAGVFPIAMGCLLIFASLILLLQAILWRSAPKEPGDPFDVSRFLTWIGLAILLFLMVMQVDFYLGMFAFIVLSYLVLAQRGLILSLSISALFTLVIYVGFSVFLNVPTPSKLQAYLNWF